MPDDRTHLHRQSREAFSEPCISTDQGRSCLQSLHSMRAGLSIGRNRALCSLAFEPHRLFTKDHT